MPSSEFVDPDLLDPNFDNGMSEEERLLILERLKRQQVGQINFPPKMRILIILCLKDDKRDGFSERMRYWDASRGKQQDEYDEQMRVRKDSGQHSLRDVNLFSAFCSAPRTPSAARTESTRATRAHPGPSRRWWRARPGRTRASSSRRSSSRPRSTGAPPRGTTRATRTKRTKR